MEGQDASPGGTGGRSTSTARTLRVLEALVAGAEPTTLTDLARRAEVPLATCSAVAAELESHGYASRTVVGRSHLWRPSLQLYALGMATLRRNRLGPDSEPILRSLRDKIGIPCHLGILEGASVVYVAKAATEGMVQFNTYLGKTAPFNLTALGRAVAAFLPEAERDDLVGRALPGEGPRGAAFSRAGLQTSLDQARARGYAVEDQEEEAGIACIAAPVLGPNTRPIAAVGVTGFATDLLGDRHDWIAEEVVGAAEALATRIGLRSRDGSGATTSS